jgi:hypothetical protein
VLLLMQHVEDTVAIDGSNQISVVVKRTLAFVRPAAGNSCFHANNTSPRMGLNRN